MVFWALQSSWHSAFETFKHAINSSNTPPLYSEKHPSPDNAHQLHSLAHGPGACCTCTSAKNSRELWQGFDAFLDLTVEALRHLNLHPSGRAEWLCSDVSSRVHDMGRLVLQGSSLVPLKRLLDILTKLIDGPGPSSSEVVKRLASSLPLILNSAVVGRVIRSWMSVVGVAVLFNALDTPGSHESAASPEDVAGDDEDIGLVKTIVRKLVLLLLKFVVAMGSGAQGVLYALFAPSHAYM